MSLYIENKNKVNSLYINVGGEKKNVKSVWVNKNGSPTKVFSTENNGYDWSTITWANGTDEQISAMLDAHYAGTINIHDYWNVGDERTVHLNAMGTDDLVGETHVEQDVTMVLMNEGGKTLVEPVNGINTCAFVVGLKNPLIKAGYMNPGSTDTGGWINCKRRKWCNSTFKESMPTKFKELFKLHKNYSGDQSNLRTSTYDYFFLISEKELCGQIHASNSKAEALNSQFTYFKNIENQKTTYVMWTRSNSDKNYKYFVAIFPAVNESDTDLYGNNNSPNNKFRIRPFGCI